MNKMKFFDRTQLLISIIGIAAFAISIAIFVPMFLTAKITYNESGAMESIEYNLVLQSIYSIFALTNVLALVWFVIRALTYKMRVKEDDSL